MSAPTHITDIRRAEEIRLLYASIVECSHDAIISKDLDGVISAWNPAAQRMFGYTEQEAIGQPITMLIPPDLREEEQELLRRLRLGERIENHETVWLNKAGEAVDVSVTMSPLRDTAGAIIGCAKIARDITKARQINAALRQSEIERTVAQDALRESEERFRLIANTAPVMIWMSDVDRQMVYLNQTWIDYTGRSLDATLGYRWIEVVHPDDVSRCRSVYVTAFDQRQPFHVDHRLRRHDGEYRWAETVGVPRYNIDGSFAGYIGTAVDITERKLAEEALSTVSQKLIEAHEQERSRIARELHDDINQRLAFLNLRLGYLEQSPPASTVSFEREIAALSQHITDIVSDIQGLSHGLHSSRLELLGLEAAAVGFCEELSNRHGVTIDVHVENVPKALAPDISLCLYRVLQEALQNVVKHSSSPRADVSLHGEIDQLNLVVNDSGVGFDPHQATNEFGLGVTSMKERLRVVGGQFSIHSERGRGTMIHAVVPLRLEALPL